MQATGHIIFLPCTICLYVHLAEVFWTVLLVLSAIPFLNIVLSILYKCLNLPHFVQVLISKVVRYTHFCFPVNDKSPFSSGYILKPDLDTLCPIRCFHPIPEAHDHILFFQNICLCNIFLPRNCSSIFYIFLPADPLVHFSLLMFSDMLPSIYLPHNLCSNQNLFSLLSQSFPP